MTTTANALDLFELALAQRTLPFTLVTYSSADVWPRQAPLLIHQLISNDPHIIVKYDELLNAAQTEKEMLLVCALEWQQFENGVQSIHDILHYLRHLALRQCNRVVIFVREHSFPAVDELIIPTRLSRIIGDFDNAFHVMNDASKLTLNAIKMRQTEHIHLFPAATLNPLTE